jgi:hypothetical protein
MLNIESYSYCTSQITALLGINIFLPPQKNKKSVWKLRDLLMIFNVSNNVNIGISLKLNFSDSSWLLVGMHIKLYHIIMSKI